MKCIIVGWIAGLADNFTRLKAASPLNPILGETVQSKLDEGTIFYAEQISHHPPISAF